MEELSPKKSEDEGGKEEEDGNEEEYKYESTHEDRPIDKRGNYIREWEAL